MHIKDLVREAFEGARAKGWHDKYVSFAERIALIHSEASEALEAFREKGHLEPFVGANGKSEGVPSELADVVIRIADLCGVEGIDLEAAIVEKLAFNATRPHRHGGKHL